MRESRQHGTVRGVPGNRHPYRDRLGRRPARGKACFTTPYTFGQYLLMDYMNRKTRTVH